MFDFLKKHTPNVSNECVEFDAFKEHWKQIRIVIDPIENYRFTESEVRSVRAHLFRLTELLTTGLLASTPFELFIEFCYAEKIFERLCIWGLHKGDYQKERAEDQLRMFESLVADSNSCKLYEKPFLRPLFSLLAYYHKNPSNFEADELVTQLLQSLCLWIGRDPSILQVFFCISEDDQGPAGFLLFSLLLSYVYRDGQVGNRARDSLLLIFSHSARCAEISEYITNNSDFCPVLAAGLSGLYSSLPRRLEFRGDEFCSLERYHWESVPSLSSFMQSLLFINSVCELAEKQVLKSLLSFLYSGFLVPVLGPSLHYDNQEESLCSTAYLELFIRSVTSKSLLKCLLQFIALHEHEGVPILITLTNRTASNHRECLAALSLFSTLISINCEDIIFQIILRYLIPCTHMLWTHRNLVRQKENLVISAEHFLRLTPKMLQNRRFRNGSFRINEDLSFNHVEKKYEYFDLEHDLAMAGAAPNAIDQIEVSYMDYLEDSHNRINEAEFAISDWVHRYDGLDPAPNFMDDPSKLMTSVPELIEEKTASTLSKFLSESLINDEMPVSLDELGIKIDTDENDENDETYSTIDNSLNDKAEIIQKPKSARPKTEVDEFYRALMDDYTESVNEVVNSTSAEIDLSMTEELFQADIVAVENLITNKSRENEKKVDDMVEILLTEKNLGDQKTQESDTETERSILELSAVEEQLNLLSDDTLLGTAHTTIQLPVKISGAPHVGSFLSILFGRIEQMPTNSLYLNLMLTGLISQLAALPIALTRSLLLDTRIMFQLGVPSLLQVLTRVKAKIDAFAVTCTDYVELCHRASQFLIQRENEFTENTFGAKNVDDKNHLKKFEKNIKKKAEEAQRALLVAKLNHDMREKYSSSQSESLRIQNIIYASVVLKEFSKELASLAHEHAINL